MKTEEKKPSMELSVPPTLLPPETFDDMEGGVGFENPLPDEQKSSFLYLLQSNAKVCMRGAPEYIAGAAAGMFYNAGTGTLYEEGVEFVPVFRQMTYVEWGKIDPTLGLNGGFKGQYAPDSDYVRDLLTPENRFGKVDTGQDSELQQTFTLHALIGPRGFTYDQAEAVAIPFTSIKIKHYRDWFERARKIRYANSKGQLINPDIYHHRWWMSSEFEQKWKPNGAWNIRIALTNGNAEPRRSFVPRTDPVFVLAKELHDAVAGGRVKADYATAEPASGDADGSDVPF